MAALTFTSKVDKVIGTTSKGLKIVSTLLTTADGGLDATDFAITPLKSITAFLPSFRLPTAAGMPTTVFAQSTSFANKITITPGGDLSTAVIEIISFGV